MIGEGVPAGWSVTQLADLVDVLDGQRIPVNAKERSTRTGEVPYYGAAGQVGTIDRAIFNEDLVLLGEDGVQFLDPLKRKAYRISGPAWVNNHAHVLRVRSGVDWRFLEHYLNHFDYRGFANGTTRLKLTQAAMRRLPVAHPSVDEQRQIVEILEDHLSRLDAGIHDLVTAAKRNEHLRISTYRSVFARYADLERPLTEAASIENGQTPKGLADLLSSIPGEDSVPFFKVGDMNGGDGRRMPDARFYVDRRSASVLGLHTRAPGLVLIPKRGGAIATNKKRILDVEAGFDLNTMGLRPRLGLSTEYLWRWFQSVDLGRIADGTAVPQINAKQIESARIPVLGAGEQEAVLTELSTVVDASEAVGSEISRARTRAAALRRALLSAALMGRLTGAASDMEQVEEMADV